MKILWITNIKVDLENQGRGGWLTGALLGLKKYDNEICISYPDEKNVYEKCSDKFEYYTFIEKDEECFIDNQKDRFVEIINAFQPDIIHIWGTEYLHTYSAIIAAELCNKLDSTIISIQGLISFYEKVYLLGIPNRWKYFRTLIDLHANSSLIVEKNKFSKKAKYEIEAIKKAKHIIGRTDWDRACVRQINNNCEYYFCNEIMRNEFYEESKWKKTKLQNHTIFMSQASYPIKGFHKCMEAYAILKETYPDLRIVVAGSKMFEATTHKLNFLPNILKFNSYQLYLYLKAKRLGIIDNIIFVGEQSASEMKEHLLNSSVFVSGSNIENSSNSISEAKLLGVPCVSSFVGGVCNSITHGVDGFVYPWNEPNLLAFYIQQIFEEKIDVDKLSKSAIINESKRCDPTTNTNRLLEIYSQLNK